MRVQACRSWPTLPRAVCSTSDADGNATWQLSLGPPQYEYAGLPIGSEGQFCYCLDGCKVGESTGSGTGVPVYFSNGSWRVFSTDTAVTN